MLLEKVEALPVIIHTPLQVIRVHVGLTDVLLEWLNRAGKLQISRRK